MTRAECEQKIKELMIQARDIAREYDPRIGREIGMDMTIWKTYSWITVLEPDDGTDETHYVLQNTFLTDEQDGEDDDT